MTGFNTQTAKGEYKLQFETDDYDKFRYIEEAARRCVDNRHIEVCSPLVHAHWETIFDELGNYGFEKCSACGYEYGSLTYRYCPNCGAKMDGNENEK